ncbi:hypothetical protein D3C80_1799060 [compost metagenome]
MEKGLALSQGFTTELLLTSVIIMIVLSELNYRFVEVPLRRKGAEIARQKMESVLADSVASSQHAKTRTQRKEFS